MIPVLPLLEHVHGHLGWLSVAALLHPAIILRRPRRRARLSVALATAFTVATAVLGGAIYPEYRAHLKPVIFAQAPQIGWLFERKEHLAVGAVAFAVIGCVAHWFAFSFAFASASESGAAFSSAPAPKPDPALTEPGAARAMARLAHHAFVVAAVLAALVATLGVTVASYRSF